MGCTYDVFQIKVKKEEHAKKFAELWNKVLGEGDYLYYFDEDTDLFEEFIEEDGLYVLNIEEEPLFGYYDGGDQIHLMIMSFIEMVPDVELEASYTCTFNNCGDALYNTYNYSNRKLIIRCAYSECGEGNYCPECDEELEIRLIELEPEQLVKGYTCPLCGEEIEYEASVDVFTLELVNGKWKYPEGFSFRPQIEAEDENKIAETGKNVEIPQYILDKTNAKKSGMAKIMIAQSSIRTLMNADLQPKSTKRLKMTIDYIDLPIKIVAIPEEAPGDIIFNVYLRQIWDDDSAPADGIITWNPSSGSFENAIADTDIAEQVKSIVVATYYFLILYLATTDEFKEYDTTDLDLENLLIYTEDDSIKSRVVYGTSRPDLLANGLMGGHEYVRPCAQEEMKMDEAKKKYN